MPAHGFNCSDKRITHASSTFDVVACMSAMACKAFANCNTSRGLIFFNGILATKRSKSPVCLMV